MNRPKVILVPTDFSRHSEAALERACELAERDRSELHIVNVIQGAPNEDKRRVALEQLARTIEPHLELKLDIRREVVFGIPYRAIVEYAIKHHVELIVMGTAGRTGLAHLVLGSTAERVLQSSTCPVFVVKAGSESASDEQESAEPTGEESQSPDFIPVVDDNDVSPAFDLIRRALKLRATDIHLDPGADNEVSVRLRIDGRIEEYCTLDRNVADHLQQQVKLAANLDIADPFRPKEGRMQIPSWLKDLEVRVTTAPVAGGEAMALRLFSRDAVFLPLEKLGLTESSMSVVLRILKQAEGAILVTGPTGAGKTTTVYSMLETISGGSRNIVSIEDPVEFAVPFVRQMSVDERNGITMSSGLRILLRMDPDIIFVGEIRDGETANIAMRAASSGRHVFSTLHTRDVAATVTAIRDLQIDNRSIAANLNGIINQRLVRKLCMACKKSSPLSDSQRELYRQHELTSPESLSLAAGCDLCRGTGYRGRIAVFETAFVSGEIRTAIASGVPEADLRQLVRSQGTLDLTCDALIKASDGSISLDEAINMRWQ